MRGRGDFLALPEAERALAVQGDSVEGRAGNRRDVLSLHVVARKFQLYLPKDHGDPAATVRALDRVERAMGSRERFMAVFGTLLLDRGVEFDDFEGIERSCLEPGERRCCVYYCDAQESNQRSQCERNHEQIRRILPKGRTDMAALSDADVAACCSHVYVAISDSGRWPRSLQTALPAQDFVLHQHLRHDRFIIGERSFGTVYDSRGMVSISSWNGVYRHAAMSRSPCNN